MEGLNCFQSPGLSLFAFCFGPDHRFPIGRKDQTCAGIGKLDPAACRFLDIQKKRALNAVFVGTCFDMDTVLKKDISSAQDVFALVRGIGEVMETTIRVPVFFGAGKIIGLVIYSKPRSADSAVIKLDHFRDTAAKAGFHKRTEL